MPNEIFSTEEITLQDGRDVTLKPLVIGRLRRFMKAWRDGENLEDGDDGFDVYINCCGIALEENFKGSFDSLKADPTLAKEGEYLSAEYKDYLLDTLEIDSIYRILNVCAGIDLQDPKLQELAMEAALQNGKTSTL